MTVALWRRPLVDVQIPGHVGVDQLEHAGTSAEVRSLRPDHSTSPVPLWRAATESLVPLRFYDERYAASRRTFTIRNVIS